MDGLTLDGGSLPLVTPNSTMQEQVYALNEVIKRLNSLLKTQVFADDTSKRMLFGYQKGGFKNGTRDFGIKVSQEGIDVTTATSSQLLFEMDMDTWRWFDPDALNYVNIGLRSSDTYGFEMAKPGETLDDPA